MASTPPTDAFERRHPASRSFLPLALITIGVVFLLGNLVPERGRGGLILLGLGAAFLVGRLTTGRRGYAVPAGILIGLGSYLALQEVQGMRLLESPGWFFLLLGLGFVLVYAIGLRPAVVWPLFPATVLIGLGLLLFGVASLGALASLSWIVGYWPLALVVLGLWLLVRDHLPPAIQRPVATLGGLALLVYGVLAAAASVAAGGTLARTGFINGFGPAPFTDTVALEAPIAGGQTFTVDNPNGRTSISVGGDANVHVVATRHYSKAGRGPDVRLTPGASGVSLNASSVGGDFPFGGGSWVEYAVDVPVGINVSADSESGQVDIDGVGGSVHAQTGSGSLNLANLGGAVQAQSGSGVITLNNVAGEVRVTTGSGQVRGTRLRHLSEASSGSGSMALEGIFTDPAQIRATSGTVNIKLLPGSAEQLDVKTGTGSVVPQGLLLTGGSTSQRQLSGALGSPAAGATLSVETGSGSVLISQ